MCVCVFVWEGGGGVFKGCAKRRVGCFLPWLRCQASATGRRSAVTPPNRPPASLSRRNTYTCRLSCRQALNPTVPHKISHSMSRLISFTFENGRSQLRGGKGKCPPPKDGVCPPKILRKSLFCQICVLKEGKGGLCPP